MRKGKERQHLAFDSEKVHSEDVLDSVPEGAQFVAIISEVEFQDREELEIKDTYLNFNDKQ